MYILRKLCIYLLNCDKLFREWGGGLGKAEATLLVYQNMTLPIYVRSDISVYIKKTVYSMGSDSPRKVASGGGR